MRTFTLRQQTNGEMAVRKMDERAQWYFNNTDPIKVFEVDDGEEKEYWLSEYLMLFPLPFTFDKLEEYFIDSYEYFMRQISEEEE